METVSQCNLIPSDPYRVTMEMHSFCLSPHSNASMALAFFACSVISKSHTCPYKTYDTSLFPLTPTHTNTHTHTEARSHIFSCIHIFLFFSHNRSICWRWRTTSKNPGGNRSYFWCLMSKLYFLCQKLPGCTRTCMDRHKAAVKSRGTSWSSMCVFQPFFFFFRKASSTSRRDGLIFVLYFNMSELMYGLHLF